jgi:riboflavin biosynthesis pyrimidine reductase
VRILIDEAGRTGEVTGDRLLELYAAPRTPWLRANMVTTVDGSATGPGGRSGSINNEPDHRVFATLRGLADGILVGAGTAATEGYGPADRPLVLVTRRAQVPEKLTGHAAGRVLVATCATAPGLDAVRQALGDEHVLVHGEHAVDLPAVLDDLRGRGLAHVLCEGGPHLLGDLLAAGCVDELCATTVPRLVGGGGHPRLTAGPEVDLSLRATLLLEEDGTLLGRWLVE